MHQVGGGRVVRHGGGLERVDRGQVHRRRGRSEPVQFAVGPAIEIRVVVGRHLFQAITAVFAHEDGVDGGSDAQDRVGGYVGDDDVFRHAVRGECVYIDDIGAFFGTASHRRTVPFAVLFDDGARVAIRAGPTCVVAHPEAHGACVCHTLGYHHIVEDLESRRRFDTSDLGSRAAEVRSGRTASERGWIALGFTEELRVARVCVRASEQVIDDGGSRGERQGVRKIVRHAQFSGGVHHVRVRRDGGVARDLVVPLTGRLKYEIVAIENVEQFLLQLVLDGWCVGVDFHFVVSNFMERRVKEVDVRHHHRFVYRHVASSIVRGEAGVRAQRVASPFRFVRGGSLAHASVGRRKQASP